MLRWGCPWLGYMAGWMVRTSKAPIWIWCGQYRLSDRWRNAASANWCACVIVYLCKIYLVLVLTKYLVLAYIEFTRSLHCARESSAVALAQLWIANLFKSSRVHLPYICDTIVAPAERVCRVWWDICLVTYHVRLANTIQIALCILRIMWEN